MYHFAIKSFVCSDTALCILLDTNLQTNNVNIALLCFKFTFSHTFAGNFSVRNTCAVVLIRILQCVNVKKSLFVERKKKWKRKSLKNEKNGMIIDYRIEYLLSGISIYTEN